MSDHPKLTYFNGRGKAELIRYVLAAAGVEYTDERFAMEDWPKYKPNTPFGQVPTMTIDGHVFCQSAAIARFYARKHGLAGKNPMEELRADMVVECVLDVFTCIVKIYHEKDEAKNAELKEKFVKEQFPIQASNFIKFLEENEHPNCFVGDHLTWADLAFFNLKDALEMVQLDGELKHFPSLDKFCDHVAAIPSIAAWIAKRPQSAF